MQRDEIPAIVDGTWHHLSQEGEEQTEELRLEQQAESEQLAIDILNTFSTPSGQRVWSRLWQHGVLQAPLDTEFVQPSVALPAGSELVFVEAQRALIMGLHRAMVRAGNLGKE